MDRTRSPAGILAVTRRPGGGLVAQSVARAQRREGDVVLEPICVGVCGTDLDILRGERPAEAEVLGHEGLAVIAESDHSSGPLARGTLVVPNPVDPRSPSVVLGHSWNGLLQQELLLPHGCYLLDQLIPFDLRLPMLAGVLVEPLATVVYAHEVVAAPSGARVGVIGAGPIGLLHAMYATAEEQADVVVISSDRHGRAEWSVSRGLLEREQMVVMTDRVVDEIRERCGDGLDAVYVCTPRAATRSAMGLAEVLVRDGGSIDVVAGLSTDPEDRMMRGLDIGEVRTRNTCGLPSSPASCRVALEDGRTINLVGQRGTAARHVQRAMAHLVDGRTPFERVISHAVPLPASPDLILEMARAIPQHRFNGAFMKVAVLVHAVAVSDDVTVIG